LFKQVVADPTTHEIRSETRIWTISAIALIQVGYWIRYRLRPALLPLYLFEPNLIDL
jgi:hypothetical protein